MIELEVIGVRIDLPANSPVLLLKEVPGNRFLPVWIGAAEASSIVNALEGIESPRPLTHDLMVTLLTTLGHSVTRGVITELTDEVFLAELQVDGHVITARPSDVVALAVRMGFPLLASEGLMDQVGVEASESEPDEVERFRVFLDTITPEDFES